VNETVTITPMRRRHLPEVLAIEAQVYPRPWSSRMFEDELDRSGRSYVVARRGDRVVGYAGVLLIAEDGHIATVAVDPAERRQGIGRALLLVIVEQALALGAAQLTLEVRVTNAGAQDLYRAFGFAPAGARKAYYSDNGEDALVMWVHDVDHDDYRARLDALAVLGPAIIRSGFDGERTTAFSHPAARSAAHPAAHPAHPVHPAHPAAQVGAFVGEDR
jgi:ribosomal-protein-alanine N-acetyltransferase